jgi:hypothetical protein
MSSCWRATGSVGRCQGVANGFDFVELSRHEKAAAQQRWKGGFRNLPPWRGGDRVRQSFARAPLSPRTDDGDDSAGGPCQCTAIASGKGEVVPRRFQHVLFCQWLSGSVLSIHHGDAGAISVVKHAAIFGECLMAESICLMSTTSRGSPGCGSPSDRSRQSSAAALSVSSPRNVPLTSKAGEYRNPARSRMVSRMDYVQYNIRPQADTRTNPDDMRAEISKKGRRPCQATHR